MPGEMTQFELVRTECACWECVTNCKYLAGYLIPADLEIISEHLSETDLVSFSLQASPGEPWRDWSHIWGDFPDPYYHSRAEA
jgi:hypothetical protein